MLSRSPCEWNEAGLLLTDFLLPYPRKLLLCPAERMKPGMTGPDSSSSIMDGPGLPAPDVSELDSGSGSGGSASFSGLGCAGMLADLIRVKVFGVIDCPANGEAVTLVPAVGTGAGCGLLDRNRGWISSSGGGSKMACWSGELIVG